MDIKTTVTTMKTLLEKESLTCIIADNGKIIFKSDKRGVAPLMNFLKIGQISEKLYLVDKVIGKAAALLCIKAGFIYVCTDVISTPAKNILKTSSIDFDYIKEVPVIQNRTKTGLCPMENLSKGINDPESMYKKILVWIDSK